MIFYHLLDRNHPIKELLMKYLLALFVSFSAFASPFTGSFRAQEMSLKPLYDLEVDYALSIRGDEIYSPRENQSQYIRTGFTSKAFEKTFFHRPDTNQLVFAQKLDIAILEIIESSVGPGKKRLKFSADILVVDPARVNLAFKEAVLVSKKEIRIEGFLTQLPIKLTVCVASTGRFYRSDKSIGCQSIQARDLKSGKLLLDKIDFSRAPTNRDLVYSFSWDLEGVWIAGKNFETPRVIFNQ